MKIIIDEMIEVYGTDVKVEKSESHPELDDAYRITLGNRCIICLLGEDPCGWAIYAETDGRRGTMRLGYQTGEFWHEGQDGTTLMDGTLTYTASDVTITLTGSTGMTVIKSTVKGVDA